MIAEKNTGRKVSGPARIRHSCVVILWSFVLRHSSLSVSSLPDRSQALQLTSLRLGESLANGIPIHDVPPGIDVVGALVLILQVIRMLPNIDTHDRSLALHIGTVLVGGADDLKLAIRPNQPRPAAAEAADTRLFQLLLERR